MIIKKDQEGKKEEMKDLTDDNNWISVKKKKIIIVFNDKVVKAI